MIFRWWELIAYHTHYRVRWVMCEPYRIDKCPIYNRTEWKKKYVYGFTCESKRCWWSVHYRLLLLNQVSRVVRVRFSFIFFTHFPFDFEIFSWLCSSSRTFSFSCSFRCETFYCWFHRHTHFDRMDEIKSAIIIISPKQTIAVCYTSIDKCRIFFSSTI